MSGVEIKTSWTRVVTLKLTTNQE